jgi:hypothetical protein
MHIVLGISTICFVLLAFYFAIKAYVHTDPHGGGFLSALMLGGMAGKERFTALGWRLRKRAVISQILAVATAVGWWATR